MNPLAFKFAYAAFIATTALPVVAHAQSASVTRAQTRADLVALEHIGFYPAYSHGPDYPLNFQEAERKVAAQRAADSQYGPSPNGTLDAGTRE
ncbi:DUF4148 domain-containing protein [Paraburkholderia strydomiana]